MTCDLWHGTDFHVMEGDALFFVSVVGYTVMP